MQIRKLAPGDRLLDYRILEKIGEGGFGEVFRAEHEVLGRIVAIKVPRDLEALSALRLEGVIQATLDHPAIVKTLEISISHDPPYVVLEHVDGMSLAEMLKREGPLHWKRASRILLEGARALKHAHERGVVHGDVKPGNVLVEPGDAGKVRLTDFGLGRVFEGPRGNMQISRSLELATSGPEVQGTLRYLAPEVQRGEPADERSDLYSWGVLLFEAVTGKLPEGREVPSDLVKGIPWEMDQVFETCFQRREKRPRSLDQGIVALDRLLTIGTRPRGESQDETGRASAAIPFRTQSGRQLVTPIVPPPVTPAAPGSPARSETADALHALRMLGAPASAGALPAMPADGLAADKRPVEGLAVGGADSGRVQAVVAPVAPGATPPELDLGGATRLARGDESFQRWRTAFCDLVRSRFATRPSGVTVVPAEGFDFALGVTTEGEPHHRVYAVTLPYVDQETARRLVKSARQVFEREKGIWEKEVTFALLAREVREKDLVLMALRSLPMGWWRRRRVVLQDLGQDKLYATELGCDPRGNPLKRLFFDAVRDASVETSKLAQAATASTCGVRPGVRKGRECVRNGILGVSLALTATLGLICGAVSVEKGFHRMNKRHRGGHPLVMGPEGPRPAPIVRGDARGPVIDALDAATRTEAPKTETPTARTEAPRSEAPTCRTEAPRSETPTGRTEAPKTETPTGRTEAPKAEAPKAEAPRAEAPKAQAPKPEPRLEDKPAPPALEEPQDEDGSEAPEDAPPAPPTRVYKF